MKWIRHVADPKHGQAIRNTYSPMKRKKLAAKPRLRSRLLLQGSLDGKISESKEEMPMLLLIILLVLLFGGGGGYYGHQRWGMGGGLGIGGTVLVIVVVLYLLGGLRL
jgi:hypothetical protein